MTDQRLQEDAERLRALEAEYLRARAFVGSKAYEDANSAALERITLLVQIATPKAVEMAPLTVGAISEVLHQLREPLELIRKYESLKKSLDARRP